MKLTEQQRSTLREMESYQKWATPYTFRQATCRQLESMGLAEATRKDVKRPPFRTTDLGRLALSSGTKQVRP
jgi:hypothetical protein